MHKHTRTHTQTCSHTIRKHTQINKHTHAPSHSPAPATLAAELVVWLPAFCPPGMDAEMAAAAERLPAASSMIKMAGSCMHTHWHECKNVGTDAAMAAAAERLPAASSMIKVAGSCMHTHIGTSVRM